MAIVHGIISFGGNGRTIQGFSEPQEYISVNYVNIYGGNYERDGSTYYLVGGKIDFLEGYDQSGITGTIEDFSISWKKLCYLNYDTEDHIIGARMYSGHVEKILFAGDDTFYASADWYYRLYGGNDRFFGSTGQDYAYGGDGNDIIEGFDGNDMLSGDKGKDEIYGGAGSDSLWGGSGADILKGEVGDDQIYGGSGNDTIFSGEGNDVIYSGKGDDVIVFDVAPDTASNIDAIYDFSRGSDLIGLSADVFSDFSLGELSKNEFFSARGAVEALTASQRIIFNRDTGDLYYDADGVGGVDAVKIASLYGVHKLTVDDFVIL